MHPERIRLLKEGKAGQGPMVYWMSRDQRSRDNWSLLFAQKLSFEKKVPLVVVFCLVPHFLGATLRQYAFMIKGLREVEHTLKKKNIPFYCLFGNPEDQLPSFIKQMEAAGLIIDFDPLRPKRKWKKAVADRITIPFWEVDAHNIVPCWIASPKREFGAHTLRPKLQRILYEFLEDFPPLKNQPFSWGKIVPPINWERLLDKLPVDRSVPAIDWLNPGEKEALRMLKYFIKQTLTDYPKKRNDPNQEGQSNLSPYLHFGQISAQRITLEVQKSGMNQEARKAYLEELIVRRELSDNFCFYNPDYDKVSGYPAWAQKTLQDHRFDPREFLYSPEQFEKALTHDPLWNAAQLEMVRTGKMHGYMRMYWAKKILEWTPAPEEAQKIAIYLNDKYELDGRDPNGYTGIAWSLGGVHDRAWGERPIFGKIRYMSYKGLKSKFDIQAYIQKNS
ncbi:MAG: deoxyribodipyrimidine photolyase [Desulfobacca sp.]|nr:deoxyribodipyrimidine photolyase [Desulfobacca sp.]